MGSLFQKSHSKVVRLAKAKREDTKIMMAKATQGLLTFSDERVQEGANAFIFELFSDAIYEQLKSWNFPCDLPTGEGFDEEAFWTGFIYASANFNPETFNLSIYFKNASLNQKGIQFLKTYEALSGLPLHENRGITWRSKKNTQTLLTVFPILAQTLTPEALTAIHQVNPSSTRKEG